MRRQLAIYQYGSELYPEQPTYFDPDDWIQISFSESSPSERSCSQSCPHGSEGSSSDASSRDFQSETFNNISSFFQDKMKEIGAGLPSNWSPEEFTRMVIGEEEE